MQAIAESPDSPGAVGGQAMALTRKVDKPTSPGYPVAMCYMQGQRGRAYLPNKWPLVKIRQFLPTET